MSKENVRHYLAVFKIAAPTNEHGKISDVIAAASNNDYKKVTIGANCVVFAFATKQPPHSLDFSKIMVNGDEVIFVEVESMPYTDGFSYLKGWFNSHLQK